MPGKGPDHKEPRGTRRLLVFGCEGAAVVTTSTSLGKEVGQAGSASSSGSQQRVEPGPGKGLGVRLARRQVLMQAGSK